MSNPQQGGSHQPATEGENATVIRPTEVVDASAATNTTIAGEDDEGLLEEDNSLLDEDMGDYDDIGDYEEHVDYNDDVDGGSAVDILPYSIVRQLHPARYGFDPTDISIYNYIGEEAEVRGALPLTSVKGQALADFLAHHPSTEFEEAEEVDIGMVYVASMTNNHWTMYFDGSSTEFSVGVGIVVETPEGQKFQFAFQLDFTCTNNQAEYEALIVGLEILQEMGAWRVLVFGNSQLVINQMNKEFKCTSWGLLSYHALADQLANTFD
ncbi:uncharacterized protein LOC112194654 [Rosa chinensis]|uniref:uncharacterized protein LOC112194654 n=1 Tax=Rosa chinensis TaxID=74649 RepID=UPI000D097219|nr:uncharacterized protein LOC112194654 [Rosa chinensis]